MLSALICTVTITAGTGSLRLLVIAGSELEGAQAELRDAIVDQGRYEPTFVSPSDAPASPAERRAELVTLAKEAWSRGKDLALQLKTERAIDQFTDAAAAFGRVIDQPGVSALLAACLVDLGAAWLDKRREEKAVAAFRSAILADQKTRPDPKVYNPDVIGRYNAALQAVMRGPHGSLTVLVKPDDAEVILGGQVVGRGSVMLRDLPVGEHWLGVRRDGYDGFAGQVKVKGDAGKAQVSLRPLPPGKPVLQRALSAARGASPAGPELLDELAAVASAQSADAVLTVAKSGQGLRALLFTSADKRVAEPIAAGSAREVALALGKGQGDAGRDVSGLRLASPAELQGVHPLLAILPLGVGQFAEGRSGAGLAFASSQIVMLAANVAVYSLLRADRRDDGSYANPARDRRLKVAVNITFAILLADLAVGAVDGLWHR